MILPTYTEEQILKELLKDYAAVKRYAKKIANKDLAKFRKSGKFIREDEYWCIHYTSETRNKWFVTLVYNQTKTIPWYFSACCIVEGSKRSKDYYVVRGVNTEKPYFVQFTTHTLLRCRERNNIKGEMTLENIASQAFLHRETAIAAPNVDIEYQMMLTKVDDSSDLEDMNYWRMAHFAG